MQLLLERGADIHVSRGGRPLAHEIAACVCHSDVTRVMELLVKHGVNLKVKDLNGMLPLYLSCKKAKIIALFSRRVKMMLQVSSMCYSVLCSEMAPSDSPKISPREMPVADELA